MNRAEIKTGLMPLVKDLLFISESERPVILVDLNADSDTELLQKIADYAGKPVATFRESDPHLFFANIRTMADPADAAMLEVVQRFSLLEEFLNAHLVRLKIFKAGSPEVQIFIVGFAADNSGSVVLHTAAIQT